MKIDRCAGHGTQSLLRDVNERNSHGGAAGKALVHRLSSDGSKVRDVSAASGGSVRQRAKQHGGGGSIRPARVSLQLIGSASGQRLQRQRKPRLSGAFSKGTMGLEPTTLALGS
jgi:hypothetical protein